MNSMYPGIGCSHGPASDFFKHVETIVGNRVHPFSSARAALVYGLRALGLNRLDEIFVPAYLSHCVLSAISRIALPALAPSKRTKAVLVWNPYGFPLQRNNLSAEAKKYNWTIVNDHAHSLYGNPSDDSKEMSSSFDVYSLSKIFPCGLGGALVARHWKVQETLDNTYDKLSRMHNERANQARTVLENAHQKGIEGDIIFEVEGVFGYLPEVVAFPSISLQYLPQRMSQISLDKKRRMRIWQQFSEAFPDRVPEVSDKGLAPFAIPLRGDGKKLEMISGKMHENLSIEASILHFDFALNMLAPQYQPALMIGCHQGWTENLTERVIAYLKDLLA